MVDEFEAMETIVKLPKNQRDAALGWLTSYLEDARRKEANDEIRRAARRLRDRRRRLQTS